jgi:transcriptional regulator of acetoin/glycerol metabolism
MSIAGHARAGPAHGDLILRHRKSGEPGLGFRQEQGVSPYNRADLDSRLLHASQPVLNRLERELADTRMSVILTDWQAWVLDRRAGERSLNGYLDRVLLAPGFSYAEKFIGTNGIGTALEEKRASHVFGHEHFIDRLQMLSCAGAPIRDPISGTVLGVIDVTCWRADASLLMSVLVQEAARDVEARLFELSGDRERALLREFLAACRRTKKPVLSLSDDLTITNVSATHLLDHDDYAIVCHSANDAAGTVILKRQGHGIVARRNAIRLGASAACAG